MGTKTGPAAKADVLLHPERLSIVRVLTGAELTAKQLAARLPDIATASLYRHLGALVDAGILTVVAERQVRGAAERTYALGPHAVLTAETLATATADDHFRYFATYLSGILAEYGRYLARGEIDLERDGTGYRVQELQLSRAELRELLTEIRDAVERRRGNAPAPDRTPILLAVQTIPLNRPASHQEDE